MACLIFMASIMIHAARITVAPCEFHAVNGLSGQLAGRSGWGDYVYRPSGSTTRQFMAQADLPHNVTINYVRLHFMDNDAVNDMAIAFVRTNKYTGASNTVYLIWTTGASSAVRFMDDFAASPSPSYSLTNIDACNYYIYLDIEVANTTLRYYGATIVY
jgi:hypothetical protein